MLSVIRLFLALLALSFPLAAKAQGSTTLYQWGNWETYFIVYNDGTWDCGIDTYWSDVDRDMRFMSNGDGLWIAMHDGQWNIQGSGSAVMRFDNGAQYYVSLTPTDRDLLLGEVSPGQMVDFLQNLYWRNWLTVDFPQGEDWSVSLRGTARNLDAFVQCLEDQAGVQSPW